LSVMQWLPIMMMMMCPLILVFLLNFNSNVFPGDPNGLAPIALTLCIFLLAILFNTLGTFDRRMH
jgi:hypothetical protein